MKNLFLLGLLTLLFAACSSSADVQENIGTYDNAPLATHISTEPASTPEPTPSPTPEPYRKWTIEELGEIIVATGTFWHEWWYFQERFDAEYIEWDSYRSFNLLSPVSGFEDIDDIRYYLLQYYTENLADRDLDNKWFVGAPFREYNDMLLINTDRWDNVRPNWETASHTLIEQDGSHAVVDTTVLVAAWYWPGVDPMEHAWEATVRFTFIEGRIDSPRSLDMFHITGRVPVFPEQTQPFESREIGVAPLISNITVLSPKAFTDDLLPSAIDLIITFTDVYDVISYSGACGVAATRFYIDPTGTISFGRDIEITRFYIDGRMVSLTAAADEIISMYGLSQLFFACTPYQLLTFPYTFARKFSVVVLDNPSEAPTLYESNWFSSCGCYGSCRLSNHAIK